MNYRLSQYRQHRPYMWVWLAAGLALVVVSTCLLLLWTFKSMQLLSVQSASMQPYIRAGDAVMVRAVPINDLKSGDVITYRSPENSEVLVTHRVVNINLKTSLVTTKGDANQSNDTKFHASLIVGRVSTNIENVGYFIDLLRSPAGLIVGVYVPAVIVLLNEARRLNWYYKRPIYHLIN